MDILTIDDCPSCNGAGCQQCQGKGKVFRPMPLVELLKMVEVSREVMVSKNIVAKEVFKVGLKTQVLVGDETNLDMP